ncbi:MAG: hypothetical protein PUI05_06445 [Peptoniphilaceae bacterium]|nr:hypothetical protein [Peptoniphilaceae bacterium]
MKNFGVILLSHGKFAKEALNTVNLICGKTENFVALELKEDESKESLKIEFIETLDYFCKKFDIVICMCDIYGGTPFNVIFETKLEGTYDFVAYAGFNLPMLIELSMQDVINSDKINDYLEEIYKKSFVDLSSMVSKDTEEQINL